MARPLRTCPVRFARHLAFSDRGRELRITTADGNFAICPVDDSRSVGTALALARGFGYALDREGTKAAYVDLERNLVHVIELPRGAELSVLRVANALPAATSLLFSRGGKYLAVAAEDGRVSIFDLSNAAEPPLVVEHRSSIRTPRVIRMAFAPDDSALFTGDEQGEIRRCVIATRLVALLGSLQREVDALEVAGSSIFISAGWTIAVMDRHTGQISETIPQTYKVLSMVAAPDAGTLFAVDVLGRLMGIGLKAAPAGPTMVPNHAGGSYDITLSDDGRTIGFIEGFRYIKIEQPGDETSMLSFDSSRLYDGHRAVEFAYSRSAVAAAGERGVLVWNVRRRDDPKYMPLAGTRSLRISDDGRRLAVASATSVDVWDLPAGTLLVRYPVRKEQRPEPIAFSGDGEQVAWTDGDGEARLSRAEGRTSVELPGLRRIHTFAFSRDGTALAAGAEDGRIALWSTTGGNHRPITLSGHDRAVVSLAFGKSGTTLASGGTDGHVKLWDLRRPVVLPIDLPAGRLPITSVALRDDGSAIAVSDIYTGLLSSSRGVSGASYPYLWLWPSTESLAGLVCGEVWRNLTKQEWARYIGSELPYEATCPDLPPAPLVAPRFLDER
jgi:WD40 repeat protein